MSTYVQFFEEQNQATEENLIFRVSQMGVTPTWY